MANTFTGTDPRTSSLNSIMYTARKSKRATIANKSLKQQIAEMESDRETARIKKENTTAPVEAIRFSPSAPEFLATKLKK